MPSFNKVILMGNLTRDPEVRYTPKGTCVCKIGLAINRTWTNESGEKKEDVTFVDVDAFGRTAENIGQYMRKGRPLMVEGRLKLDQWDDKQTGQKRSRLGVIAETVQFLGSANDGGGRSDNDVPGVDNTRPAGSSGDRFNNMRKAAANEFDGPPESDDVPFNLVEAFHLKNTNDNCKYERNLETYSVASGSDSIINWTVDGCALHSANAKRNRISHIRRRSCKRSMESNRKTIRLFLARQDIQGRAFNLRSIQRPVPVRSCMYPSR